MLFFQQMKRMFLLALAIAVSHSSCTYREKETGGDSSHSTVRLFPTD